MTKLNFTEIIECQSPHTCEFNHFLLRAETVACFACIFSEVLRLDISNDKSVLAAFANGPETMNEYSVSDFGVVFFNIVLLL